MRLFRKKDGRYDGCSEWVPWMVGVYFVLTYASALVGVLSGTWLICLLPVLVLLLGKRWLIVGICLALNPISLVFMWSCGQYCNGSALLDSGSPLYQPSLNLDRETRCFPGGVGCLEGADRRMYYDTNNLALRMMYGLVGPMPGAYVGEYPTREELLSVLPEAVTISVETLKSNDIPLPDGSGSVQLAKQMGPKLGERIEDAMEFYEEDLKVRAPERSLRVARRGQCLLLYISWHLVGLSSESFITRSPSGSPWAVVMIDIETGRPFAWETTSGRLSYRWSEFGPTSFWH